MSATSIARIRVVIVERQRLVREMLEVQLVREAGIELVGSTSAASDVLDIVAAKRPHVALFDLPDMQAAPLLSSIRARHPYVRVVVISAVSGGLRELLQAIHGVLQEGRTESLGRRERQVLALLAEGARSREIAARLGIALSTVHAHRRNLMRKLRLNSVASLTRFAVSSGVVSLEDH